MSLSRKEDHGELRAVVVRALTPADERAAALLAEGLASNLRQLRREKAWTLEEAGFRCEIGARALARLESGQGNATLRTLVRLARAYGVEAFELLRPRSTTKQRPRRGGSRARVADSR